MPFIVWVYWFFSEVKIDAGDVRKGHLGEIGEIGGSGNFEIRCKRKGMDAKKEEFFWA